MSFLKSYVGFIVIVLFAYLGIGIAFVGERLRNEPHIKAREVLPLLVTWGKYLVKGVDGR